jgi:hypothetical protein
MITIDEERFKEVFGQIFSAYKARSHGFADTHADNLGPQRIYYPKCVKVGNRDHLYWLTLVALSDRRTNSTMLYRNFARMFNRNKKLFIQGYYPSHRKMERLFRTYKIAVPVGDIALFLEKKRHLDELFNGDPFAIYNGVGNIDDLLIKARRIAKLRGIDLPFPGAKEKIFTLLAMFLSELTDLQFDDLIPIDVWVQSIATSTGVLKGEGIIKFRVLERLLRPNMRKLFSGFKDVPGAANATWILGKSMCTHCAGRDMKDICPIYDMCKGPFRRHRTPESDKHSGYIEVPSDFIPKGSNPY